jgi:hypothetical protein
MCLKYTSIKVIVVSLTLFLLFLGRNFPQLNLNDVGRNCLLGNGKKIAKFLMRTFTCRSTFLYVPMGSNRGNWKSPSHFLPMQTTSRKFFAIYVTFGSFV